MTDEGSMYETHITNFFEFRHYLEFISCTIPEIINVRMNLLEVIIEKKIKKKVGFFSRLVHVAQI